MIESRAEFKPTSGQHYNETVIVIYESRVIILQFYNHCSSRSRNLQSKCIYKIGSRLFQNRTLGSRKLLYKIGSNIPRDQSFKGSTTVNYDSIVALNRKFHFIVMTLEY